MLNTSLYSQVHSQSFGSGGPSLDPQPSVFFGWGGGRGGGGAGRHVCVCVCGGGGGEYVTERGVLRPQRAKITRLLFLHPGNRTLFVIMHM